MAESRLFARLPHRKTILNPLSQSKMLGKLALTFVLAVAAMLPVAGQAAIKCQELMAQRSCLDSSPRTVSASGYSASVSAPVLPGFSSPCWVWDRKFQCVEADPTYSCQSGTPFQTVKSDCSLTSAVTNATVAVNGVTYITSATYGYRCAWGEFTTKDNLPSGKECVLLDQTITDTASVPSAAIGSTPAGAPLNSTTVVNQDRADEYVCYSAPVTTCSDTCYEPVIDPATGTMTQKEVACSAPVTNCVSTSNQCDNTLANGSNGALTSDIALGPDGRCVNSTDKQLCQVGEIPRCLDKDNCTLSTTTPSNVQANGVAMSQEQTYICSNSVTSCAQYANVSNCVHANAWGWDNLAIRSQVGAGLGEYNQAMSRLEGIDKGMAANDPYIFSGQDMRCHYAVGNFFNTLVIAAVVYAAGAMSGGGAYLVAASALNDAVNSQAFGSDCCKDYVVEGSDSWFKFGSCSGAEVKLAVARRKGLTRYLGEYCSKESGFLFKQCVEKSRTFCVFDDMLAFTVNEQGRSQLDAISTADSVTTKVSAELPQQIYAPLVSSPPKYTGYLNNGKWVKQAQQEGSQVWTWLYPGYCRSSTAQAEAYAMHQAELEAAANTKGIQKDKLTPQEAQALMQALDSVAAFQECPSTPGLMSYLTCSLAGDNCDAARLPESPTGTGVDITGSTVSNADVNWRIQQLRSFYSLADYGVTAAMATNSTYAAVSGSVNEYVTAIGSCKTTGDCLYRYAITDKSKAGSAGARKRVTENVQFPLYTATPSAAWPAIAYLGQDGNLLSGAYQNDPNRGLGKIVNVGGQRFIFHPHLLTGTPPATIHPKILVEYANSVVDTEHPERDFGPLLVPTNLPMGTSGFFPYGQEGVAGKNFYLSGGCDANSRWCNYNISVDLSIPRHPWGSAQGPRCWGFSLDQLAALDFDKMDLSRWINSLELGTGTEGMSAEAAAQMTTQTMASANAFYQNFETGKVTNNPAPGQLALATNTDVLPKLSSADFQSYVLEVGVPANWPKWFAEAPNINPVTNVRVDWGDGMPEQTMPKHSGGQAYVSTHDYGNKLPGTYTVRVTLDTAGNGPQVLTKKIRITPNSGQAPASEQLDFSSTGTNGKSSAEYVPSQSLNQINVAPSNIQQLSPGTVEQFNQQGGSVEQK